MSSTALETVKTEVENESSNFSLWLHQIRAILKLEVKKNLFSLRSILIYLLALLPVIICAMIAIVVFLTSTAGGDPRWREEFSQVMATTFTFIYNALILRTVVFFGCAWIFMNLFRGEIVDRSLHYYFLCPVRREVLVAGKYLSGMIAAIIIFSLTTIVSLFFLYLAGYPSSLNYLIHGVGLRHAGIYVGITILACVGYGAFFLLVGLLFRNPILPALILYGWEWINFLLPPLLKKVSVVHYLHSLNPVPMDEGPFAVLAEPTPAWISIPSLLLMSVIVIALGCWKIRRAEISYSGE